MKLGSTLGPLAALVWLGCSDGDRGVPDTGSAPDAGAQMDAATDAGPDAGDLDGGGNADGGTDPRVECPAGAVLRHFSLEPVAPLPSVTMLDLPNLIPNTEVVGAGEGVENSARFDVCDLGGEPTLRGVLYRGSSFEVPSFFRLDETISAPMESIVQLPEGFVQEVRLPPSAFLVEGLREALQGNLQPLRIRLMFEYGLLVMGHEGFIAIARGRVGPTTIEYTSIYVLVGSLAEGDVFEELECGFDGQPLSTSFTLSTATFEVRACTFLGGGETTGYRIVSLAVQDSSPDLTESERARFELPTEADVERVMTYQWNHHNACDSFYLALPHAEYAASTSPAAGCGTTVPNAPMRSFDEDPLLPVLFRIRYHGGAWNDGMMAVCHHYLFCN